VTCPHCGAEVIPGSRFCHKCRKRVAGASASGARPATPTRRPSAGPRGNGTAGGGPTRFTRPGVVTLLGVLNILGGLLGLGLAAVMVFGILGSNQPMEGLALATAIFAAYGLLGAVQTATGVGLLRLRPWGRTLQIVLAGIGLLGIPCGTIVSILILVYMLKPEVKTLFSGLSPRRLPPAEVARVERLSQSSAATVAIIVVVALVGGVVVVGMVAAIAIPSLLRARVAANESVAIGNLRTVVSAQHAYASANQGFFDQLECLATPIQCVPAYPADSPSFLDTSFLNVRRSGYEYRFIPGPPAPPDVVQGGQVSPTSLGGWAYVAVPLQPGQSGVRSFCADMSGQICYRPDGSPPDSGDGTCPVSSEMTPGACLPIM
jgi:type IV pilus assembly protein PilA